jgi:hydrogenase 3 maturation protease
MRWQDAIIEFIAGENRIAILGIGNVRKGDDAAGPLCADLLIKRFVNKIPVHIQIINTGEIPENFTGDIRRFNPKRVLIIDAVIAGNKPGTIFIVNPEKIDNTDVSTHRMSLTMFCRFLEESIGCRTLIIGIEPERVDLDTKVSKNVQNSIEYLTDQLFELLSPNKI